MKTLVLFYLVGCLVVVFKLSKDLNEKSNKDLGFMYALFYILGHMVNYKYILMSWYFLIKKDT